MHSSFIYTQSKSVLNLSALGTNMLFVLTSHSEHAFTIQTKCTVYPSWTHKTHTDAINCFAHTQQVRCIQKEGQKKDQGYSHQITVDLVPCFIKNKSLYLVTNFLPFSIQGRMRLSVCLSVSSGIVLNFLHVSS